MSELTDNQSNHENEPSLEWFDAIEVDKMPQIKRSSQLLSQQTVANTRDTWKGSAVVNYKTFRKCVSNDESRTSPPISQSGSGDTNIVALKRYNNPLLNDTMETSQTSVSKRSIDFDTQSQTDYDNKQAPQTKRKRNK